jgi:ferric-dicitrate binding protein FerR (iron transport regulator)
MQSPELRRLLEKYVDNSISEEEFFRLWKSLHEGGLDADWQDAIRQTIDEGKFQGLSDPDEMAARLSTIRTIIEAGAPAGGEVRHMHSRGRVIRVAGYAAAAVVLFVSGIYLFGGYPRDKPSVAAAPVAMEKVRPGSKKAILTLADGTNITLDSVANGRIAQQGATQVLKLANGQVRYQPIAAGRKQQLVYNVMSTPMGGQYELTLPDGSNVWLNAGSSITYPTAFPGNERRVKITGEVYFEVARDKNRVFHVSAGDQEIEVLGTHFNINAYTDEGHVKTSLLEGAIKVNKVLLRPGQAFAHDRIEPTNTEQDVAWKNGVFNFNNQSLAQVMRQLARWYDLEIIYPHGIPKKEYGGEMGRDLSLEQVLKGLENSNIHFQLNGKRLTVR